MAAPDYATLYDFETQLETAWDTVFTAAGYTTHVTQDTTDKDTIYVEVKAEIGAGGESYEMLSQTVPYGNRMFDFTLTVDVKTSRTETGANTAHKTARGKVRNLLERWPTDCTGGSSINSNLTYIKIARMVRTGGDRSSDEGRGQDITTETYSGTFQVKRDAWPA